MFGSMAGSHIVEAAEADTDATQQAAADAVPEPPLTLKLADGCLSDPKLKAFMSVVDQACRSLHLMIHMNFPPDHPIEEMGRVLLALLVRYQGLEPAANALAEAELAGKGTHYPVMYSIIALKFKSNK